MLKEVIKRDGHKVPFNAFNIRKAILNANAEVAVLDQASDEEIDVIVREIETMSGGCVNIEVIQNLIEDKLMSFGHFELARKYITYRFIHNVNRSLTKAEKGILELVRGKNDELANENSNKNAFTNATQRDLIAGEVSKEISNKFILPEDIVKADENQEFHWHDKDYTVQPMINCCLINIQDMLDNNTVLNNLLIESPHSFRVACNVMTQIIASIASNQYGGQSVNIKYLGKYLRLAYEKTKKRIIASFEEAGDPYTDNQVQTIVRNEVQQELEDGVQTIQYQINTLHTTNGQSPFLTLFLHIDESYEYCDESAMIIEEIIKQRIKGVKNKDGVYVTPAFPKLVYVLDECNALKGGKYDYITRQCIDCNVVRMYPDYISAKVMREFHEGNVFSPMGCRSFLGEWKIPKDFVEPLGLSDDVVGTYRYEGRFNQGVVSINLPQIAIEANRDMDAFFFFFYERLSKCYKALLYRHKLLEGVTSDSSPIHWQHGGIARLKVGEKIDKLLHNGFSSISLGYIGIYEMCQAMLGVSHTTKEGKAFALKVVTRLRDACATWKATTGLGFALYGTPAESLCYTFLKYDRAKYGVIPNVTDHNFYTNSYHVYVGEKIDAFEKFAFESEFQRLSTGGCISYVELPNMAHNKEALAEVVKYGYENTQYFEFNTKCDYCYNCGYDGEIKLNEKNHWECPVCHCTDMKKMTVTRRTCGYLGVNDWNEGKRAEMGQRVLHL